MYLLCKSSIDYLSGFRLFEQKTVEGKLRCYRIPDYDDFAYTMSQLANIDCLTPLINDLMESLGTEIGTKSKDCISINSEKHFSIYFKKLVERVATIVSLGDSMGFSDIETGFDIKIPSSLNLSQTARCIGDLDKIFNQCPLLNIEGQKIEFKSVDTGSFWLEFMIVATGTATLLTVFAKVVDKCVTIASHIVTTKSQEEQFRTLELQNDLLESMIKSHQEITKVMEQRAVTALEEEIGITLENEDRERTVFCLDRLSDWMSKGMEIYANIESPKEIKDLFPPQEKQQRIQSPKVQIPVSNEHNDDE